MMEITHFDAKFINNPPEQAWFLILFQSFVYYNFLATLHLSLIYFYNGFILVETYMLLCWIVWNGNLDYVDGIVCFVLIILLILNPVLTSEGFIS